MNDKDNYNLTPYVNLSIEIDKLKQLYNTFLNDIAEIEFSDKTGITHDSVIKFELLNIESSIKVHQLLISQSIQRSIETIEKIKDRILDIKQIDNHDEILINFILNNPKTMELDPEDINNLGTIFSRFTDPCYPCLQINSNYGMFTKYLVASEPVFIIDFDKKSIDQTLADFNSTYQNRLCIYNKNLIEELSEDISKINYLPYKQFNFILIWNFINFLSNDFIMKFLNLLRLLIKPGGYIIFNFNNCSKPGAVQLFNKNTCSYQTVDSISKLLIQKGFIVEEIIDYNDHIDYFIIKSPGTLYTAKKQSSLGEIVPK